MYLVELIPARDTQPSVLDGSKASSPPTLGKGVIRAKDTPNFIANRVGVFSILAAFHHTRAFGLGFDVVDALTGPLIGRPKSATYRTADVVGLDTLAHVVEHDEGRPAGRSLACSTSSCRTGTARLLEQRAFGQKSERGVYRKVGKDIQVLDLAKLDYRPSGGEADPGVSRDPQDPRHRRALAEAARERAPAGEVPVGVRSATCCTTARITWPRSPTTRAISIWPCAGASAGTRVRSRSGRRPAGSAWPAGFRKTSPPASTHGAAPLPAWALEKGRTGVHTPQGSYSPAANTYRPRSALPVYRRQPFPDRLVGERVEYGKTVFETDAVRMWTTGDDIGVVSFKSKMHTIGEDVLDGILQAIDEGERGFKGLIIWQTEPPFSLGANLQGPSARPKSEQQALRVRRR